DNRKFRQESFDEFTELCKEIKSKLQEKGKSDNISKKIDFDKKKLLCEFIKYFNDINTALKEKIIEINNKIGKKTKDTEIARDNLFLKELILFYHENCIALNLKIKNIIGIEGLINKFQQKIEKNSHKLDLYRKLIKYARLEHYNITDKWELQIKQCNIINPEYHFSEGEKTIFGFLYFIVNVIDYIDEYEDLANFTLVIDDPISSLDYNNFYLISTLIKDIHIFLKENLCCKKEECKLVKPQLFILTHNLMFFNILINNIYTLKKNEVLAFELNCNTLEKMDKKITGQYFEVLKRVKNALEKKENIYGCDLRFILETITDFYQYKDIGELIESENFKIEDLEIKVIINDLSHANFEKSLNPEYFKEIHKTAEYIINKIQENFPNQIKGVL
ncbi:MAG: AAA family ATPase, partial [Rickettsiales bacterium]|nr:AAA family ATPase [Rickettsiales bacterium]